MKTLHLPLIALFFALTAPAQAAEPKLPADGWASWEVPAVDGAPFWCCWSGWDKNSALRETCDLDDVRGNHGSRDTETTDAVRLYVHVTGGKVDRLHAFAAACPVKSRAPIQQIDGVSADDSARWLSAKARREDSSRHEKSEFAMAALAMHRGELAQKEMTQLARNGAAREVRKRAIFWMGLLRGPEGAEVVRAMMFDDKEPEVRKHAAFALSQSKSPGKAEALIRQGNTDKVADVRAQAWFWLAQTGAPEAEQAISAALKKDADAGEEAVFALSQLPGERAPRALIAAAEDQSLSRQQRKRAVFWLSQSESDAAQKYLENVLARAAR